MISLTKMDKKSKKMCILDFLLMSIVIFMLFFMITFFNQIPHLLVITSGIIVLLICFLFALSDINKTIKLNNVLQNLKETKLYNESLKTLNNDEDAFKHDFRNIIQAMGGYITNNDINGLKTFYSELFFDFQKLNTLALLTPETVNNPAVYSLLHSKYTKASKLGITFNLNAILNFNELNMKIYEFTRILGILLDNAIESSCKCDEKIINIDIKKDISRNRQLLIVENTYKDKGINLERIFEKGFSSKSNNTGIGLWEVRQILNRNTNLNLYTNKDKKYFKQQLEIYDIIKKNALKVN